MSAPPLAERMQPGLSETLPTENRHPLRCQSCGKHESNLPPYREGMPRHLQRWQECDEWDQKTPVVVVLCERCSNRLIEPHPKLYHSLRVNEPFAGAMEICVDCTKRDGTRCTAAKANGGPGVIVGFQKPSIALVCGRGRGAFSGPVKLYPKPPHSCSGRAVVEA